MEPAATGGVPLWPWLAGGAIVVLGGVTAALLRRRRSRAAEAGYLEEEA
jgi:hypothetical protein